MSDVTTQGSAPKRLVLEGVPRVGKYPRQSTGAPEDHSFPACLRGYLEYKKDGIYEEISKVYGGPYGPGGKSDWHAVHEFLMGTSGAAFGNAWDPGTGIHTAWDITTIMADPLEPFRNACESVGYPCEFLLRSEYARTLGLKEKGCDDEAEYRRRIIESIRAGRPVITRGGLCASTESALITGYDEDGAVLIGWHFYEGDKDAARASVEPDPSGYGRKRNWFADLEGIILVGEKQKRPPLRDIYRAALERAVRILRTRSAREFAAGPAAYDAWAAVLVGDKDARGCADGYMAEARSWGLSFLNPLAASAAPTPEAKVELEAASACIDAVGVELATRGYLQASGISYAEKLRLVRQMQVKDAEAADHIERALAHWDK